ncbi:helix-turn-helix domain-containing protein [Massilia timonae]|uniref:helix-turn-helix domain-containing protein n=1 Tax=Massilia timonae TaxID=47229 RepID=UPI0028A214DB|nr:helix-turn-helix domain-containing protein [Massilia timonae]
MTFRTPQQAVQQLVAAGHSQAVIADRAGVKQPTISRILSGEHKDPKSSVLIKLNEFADQVAAEAAQAAAAEPEFPPQ